MKAKELYLRRDVLLKLMNCQFSLKDLFELKSLFDFIKSQYSFFDTFNKKVNDANDIGKNMEMTPENVKLINIEKEKAFIKITEELDAKKDIKVPKIKISKEIFMALNEKFTGYEFEFMGEFIEWI